VESFSPHRRDDEDFPARSVFSLYVTTNGRVSDRSIRSSHYMTSIIVSRPSQYVLLESQGLRIIIVSSSDSVRAKQLNRSG